MNFRDRFAEYFGREVAERAAKPLANGVEIEFRVTVAGTEPEAENVFTFRRREGHNEVRPGPASEAQVVFTLTPQAAETILTDPATEIGSIGVSILKLVISPDANRRISVSLKAGFLSLFSKGYLGVVTAGGAQFASFLASRGLGGMSAIKDALKKLRAG